MIEKNCLGVLTAINTDKGVFSKQNSSVLFNCFQLEYYCTWCISTKIMYVGVHAFIVFLKTVIILVKKGILMKTGLSGLYQIKQNKQQNEQTKPDETLNRQTDVINY